MSADKTIYNNGTKVYKYDEENHLIMARVIGYDEKEDLYNLKFESGGPFEGAKKWVKYDEVHNDFVRLIPDAAISFNIVKNKFVKDVMILVHPVKDNAISSMPFAICRQDSVDIFRMATKATPVDGQVWAGISINRNNCPTGCDLIQFMDCEEFLYSTIVYAYIDDTIDDILPMVFESKFDDVLKDYEKKHHGDNLVGICTSLRELLEDKGFMYDFHEAVGVIEVPFIIGEDTQHMLADIISQIECATVVNTYLIEYSKEIDTMEFERPYKLMCSDFSKATKPEDHKIYIVGYDIDESIPYLVTKYGTDNKDEIIKSMGFNIL